MYLLVLSLTEDELRTQRNYYWISFIRFLYLWEDTHITSDSFIYGKILTSYMYRHRKESSHEEPAYYLQDLQLINLQ
uniref:Uncharacterized protein n=1 Tax=Lepeophtheirus salmonis TaxID=72036 RepID=A0A0K2V6U4_LEPSM